RLAIGLRLRIEEARAARIGEDACVVHENVAAFTSVVEPACKRHDDLLIRDVQLLAFHVQPLGTQHPRGRVSLSGVTCRKDDANSLAASQLPANLQSDAAISSGDDCYPALTHICTLNEPQINTDKRGQ